MKLSNTTRLLLGIGSVSLAATFFVPLWQILLWAPQYPEGLTLKIWTNTLSGDVDIINGLNHYIGMKHIKVEMFPEFGYIGWLIALLIGIGLLAALLKSGRILFVFTLLSYVYGIAALWDFWRWGYDYGHNLDPNAAIKVPDMSYQPPLIGYKNLLNFTAYSGPDTGAWIIIAVCLMATALWWWEFFRARRKPALKVSGAGLTIFMLPMLQFLSCTTGPEPIRYGRDECSHCRMTLMDKRFGAEIATRKGRVFKFDDLNCMVLYLKQGNIQEKDIAEWYVIDFRKPDSFIPARQAFFLQSESLKSPMRGDIAAFSTENDLQAVIGEIGGGQKMTWNEVQTSF